MTFIHLTLNEPAGIHVLQSIRQTEHAGHVFFLRDNLSFGPLPVDVDNFYPRYQWLEDFFGEFSLASQQIPYLHNLHILTEIDDRMKHLDTSLVIWVGRTANDQSWIRFLAKYFGEWDSIFWIELPEKENSPDCFTKLTHTEIPDLMTSVEKPVTTRIMQLEDEYDSLIKERSLLRIMEEGSLRAVPLSYYDKIILENGPNSHEAAALDRTFAMARLAEIHSKNSSAPLTSE